MKYVYTISKEDIGKRNIKLGKCNCCNHSLGNIPIYDFMGYIQSQDVGKRIYKNGNIYQVENQQQLKERLSHEL